MKKHILWKTGATLLALATVLGCQANPLTIPKTGSSALTDSQTASTVATAELPKIDLTGSVTPGTTSGTVKIAIRWPERTVQAIPLSANTIWIRIWKNGDSTDLASDKIARGQGDITKTYNLKKDTDYRIEVKAYKETANLVDDTKTAIAYTATPVSVTLTALQDLQVPIHLTVPNPPTFTSLATAAAGGPGAEVTLNGTNFGTDASKVQVQFVINNSNTYNLTNENVSDTQIKAKLPDNAQSCQGKIKVLIDGIAATNQINYTVLSQLSYNENSSTHTFKKVSDQSTNWVTKYYAVTGVPLSLTLKGNSYTPTWQWLEVTGPISYQITKVTNTDTQAEVTADVVTQDGKLNFGAIGNYKVEFTSGTITNTVDVTALNIATWPSTAPNTANTKVSAFNFCDTVSSPNTTGLPVSMSGYKLRNTSGSITVYLNHDDFEWTFSPNDTVTLADNPWDSANHTLKFVGLDLTGAATVTATLKYDPTKSFSFPLTNVRPSSLLYYYEQNNTYYISTTTAVPENGLTIPAGQTWTMKVNQVKHTAGTAVTPNYNFMNGLTFEIVQPGTDTPADTIATATPAQYYGNYSSDYYCVNVHGLQAGNVELKVTSTVDPDFVSRTPITIQ